MNAQKPEKSEWQKRAEIQTAFMVTKNITIVVINAGLMLAAAQSSTWPVVVAATVAAGLMSGSRTENLDGRIRPREDSEEGTRYQTVRVAGAIFNDRNNNHKLLTAAWFGVTHAARQNYATQWLLTTPVLAVAMGADAIGYLSKGVVNVGAAVLHKNKMKSPFGGRRDAFYNTALDLFTRARLTAPYKNAMLSSRRNSFLREQLARKAKPASAMPA